MESYSAIINGYARLGNLESAAKWFGDMERKGLTLGIASGHVCLPIQMPDAPNTTPDSLQTDVGIGEKPQTPP